MKKLKTMKGLHNQAWTLMSEFVRRRDRGQCFTCYDKRDWKQQQAGHYVHRDCLDYDFRNINCQCVRCNKWLRGNLTAYAMALKAKYGAEIIDELEILGHQIRKFTRDELEGIIEELKKRISQLPR